MLAYRVLRAADRLWQAYAVTFTRKVKRGLPNDGKRVARRFQEADGVRERGLGDGPRATCLSLFTYYCFSSPHPLCEVPDLGVGGGRAGSRSAAMYGAGGGGKPGGRFSFFFLRFRSLQDDCGGSSKQANGGPQHARLVKRFLLHSS